MTKKELSPLAKTYFDSSPELKEIYGTEDKHFWYKEIQAINYCKREKEYFKFVKEDFEKPKKAAPKSKSKPKKAED